MTETTTQRAAETSQPECWELWLCHQGSDICSMALLLQQTPNVSDTPMWARIYPNNVDMVLDITGDLRLVPLDEGICFIAKFFGQDEVAKYQITPASARVAIAGGFWSVPKHLLQ